MNKITAFVLTICITLSLFAQQGKIDIPDLEGYITIKCDFHMHSVFSDGTVWPTVRVDEAYREGLDVISLTEHLEYRPYSNDINSSHNRSYEIAKPAAEYRNVMLIRGAEITRSMPPGHFNALFLSDNDALVNEDWQLSFVEAKRQNAFIFWNHPGWVAQQPDTTQWWPEHTQLLEQGLMHGIEVVNGSYYPEAHRWCLEKKLTLIGTSDAHSPIFPYIQGKHRTMTLIFARSATPEAIHEALRERRTAIYHEDFIIGEEIYLKELFENALEWSMSKDDNVVNVTVRNNSDLIFRLKKTSHDARLIYFRNTSIDPFIIAPKSTHSFTVRLLDGIQGGDINFRVDNFLVQPNEGMDYTLKIN